MTEQASPSDHDLAVEQIYLSLLDLNPDELEYLATDAVLNQPEETLLPDDLALKQALAREKEYRSKAS